MKEHVLFKSVGHGGAGGQGDVIQSNPENHRGHLRCSGPILEPGSRQQVIQALSSAIYHKI